MISSCDKKEFLSVLENPGALDGDCFFFKDCHKMWPT